MKKKIYIPNFSIKCFDKKTYQSNIVIFLNICKWLK